MGANCAPLLADLVFCLFFICVHFYEAECIQILLHEKIESLVVAFKPTFKHIYDVLSINSTHLHSYVDSIYLSELKI